MLSQLCIITSSFDKDFQTVKPNDRQATQVGATRNSNQTQSGF